MTLEEAIEARHSVRAYKGQPLAADAVEVLEEKIRELNEKGHLHMQLIRNETPRWIWASPSIILRLVPEMRILSGYEH